MKKPQVSGYSDELEWAGCKTVGLAYVGSNPTPATRNPRSRTRIPRCSRDAGSDACPGAVRQTVPGGCGPKWWARSWLVSGVGERVPGSALRGAAVGELES